jgi:hypothetical protein
MTLSIPSSSIRQAKPASFTIKQIAKDVENKIREMGKKPASVGN